MLNIHVLVLTHSTWFLDACMVKKTDLWLLRHTAAVQATASSQKFHFSADCLFICLLCTYIQSGPKKWTCLSVDNSAMVSGRKTCDTSKVSECCKE